MAEALGFEIDGEGDRWRDRVKDLQARVDELKTENKRLRAQPSVEIDDTLEAYEYSLAFDVEMADCERFVEDGTIRYTVEAVARAPKGKTARAVPMVESMESNFTAFVEWADQAAPEAYEDEDAVILVDGAYRRLKDPREVSEHDLITMAAMGAKNRAISDLVGGGEVSAEEVRK